MVNQTLDLLIAYTVENTLQITSQSLSNLRK